MITFYKIFSILSGIFCAVLSLYQVYICLGFLLKKKRKIPHEAASCRIAAVIPARNEERVIGGLVRSLKKQQYPETLFDIYVIPNNCSDRTEQNAVLAGAKILSCKAPVHTKGDVLRQAFSQLLPSDRYDAFCVFDADNLVSPDFLQAVNNAWCAGYDCAQGYRESKNPEDSWVAGSMTVFYRFMSNVFNESRWRRRMSAHLNGTGFMVSARQLKKTGWNTTTLTEDLEYTALCALNDCSIAWMREAVVYDEQPISFHDSAVQRRRWTTGSIQCMRRLSGKLLKKHTVFSLDAAVLFLGNLMIYIGAVSLLLTCMTPQLLAVAEKIGVGRLAVLAIAYILGLWTVLALAAYIVLRMTGKIGNARQTVLLFPWFMITWMFVNFYAAFTRAPQWKQIPHNSDSVPDALE